MLNKIISFSIQNKLIVSLLVLGLIGYGTYQFTRLPIDAVPDITDNQVQIITVTPSLGAPDVERLITFPIEQANSNIPGLKEIRSFSRFGLSLVTIVFDDDVDVYWARQQVTERLKIAEAQIPKGIGSPELAPVTTGLGEIYQYVLKPKPGYESKYDAMALRTIQDWIVRRQLVGVKGVADVSSFGGKVKQYEIAIDPAVLKANMITMKDVFTALENNNENTGGAYIEKSSTVLYIRAEGMIENMEDIKNIVVKNMPNGTPLLIRNIANIHIGNAIRYGAMTYNDEGEVAGAVVMMLKGENSSRVITAVKEKIDQIKKTLPEGVELEAFLDRTKMVNSAIGTVSKNLMEGALIVIFVLVLFLGDFRAGILVATVIPLSMLFAVIMMNLFGVSGNLMSLGALDFGLIVDGAVIIIEAVMHGLVHNPRFNSIHKIHQQDMDHEVKHAASRMMNSAVFGQMIILIVYLPIFTLEGIEGKMFKPMAQTVAFALLGAFLLSLTYIPMMSALFLSKKINHKKNISDRMMDFFTRIQQRYLKRALAYPKTIIGISIVLLLLSIGLFTRLGGEFIPELPEGDFAVETRVLTGSKIAVSSESIMKASHILLAKFPEVEKIVGKTGSGEIPTDPMPMEASDMMIILKDKSEWTSASSWDELSNKMSEALRDVPGVTFSFQYPVAMRFNELMTGAKQDVVCKIFGENLDTLSKYAALLGGVVGHIDGTKDVFVEPLDGLPQLIIRHKRDAIAQYGLNIHDINEVINTAFAGRSSGLVYEDEKHFDLVVRLSEQQRQRIEDVQNLLISTPSGSQIPLYLVADVVIEESANQIQREDAKRRIVVGFNVDGRDVQSIVSDLQTQVTKQIKLPTGYYVTYGGAFENLVGAKKRLTFAVPLSLVLILLLLYLAFGSLKHGLLIYSAIPLSAIGGILFLALRGLPFSISAGIGFIALFGVAVLNGIVLLAEFNRLKKHGETDIQELVLDGTKNRLRPVLMTAFVASLGFLPMALSNGAGAEVQRPLATVVIGGLLIATLLTLFVLPILYVLFEQATPKKRVTHKATVVIILALLVGLVPHAHAQKPITLQAALDTAVKNSLLIKQEKLQVEYQQKLKAAATDLPQTNVYGEYGQINSIYQDTKFGVSQTINFPTVYVKQKQLHEELYQTSILHQVLKQNELKEQVTKAFYNLIYLQQKQKILVQTDSIYMRYLNLVNVRFAKGEANILEKTSADLQRGQIASQLNQLKTDLAIAQLHFQVLLNTTTPVSPLIEYTQIPLTVPPDSNAIRHSSAALVLLQEKQIAQANTALERARLLPNINVGYTNTSIQGTGADNTYYAPSDRFSSIQVGLGVPLFFGAQKAKINSSKTLELVSDNTYQLGIQNLQLEYASLLLAYQNQLQTVNYFEDKALVEARTLVQTADAQLANGDINYLEWAMLINTATATQSNYADAVHTLNQLIIRLNYLTSK